MLYIVLMARLSKQDWLQEGFKILSEFAQDKLKITYLCERLKVTRGSFYHHFKSIDEFIAAMMQEWAEQNTFELIKGSNEGGEDPVMRMHILTKLIISRNHAVEAAIRSWGFYNDIVCTHLAEVDEMRLSHLQSIFKGMGYKKREAYLMSKMEYATLIGIQQMNPKITKGEMTKIFKFRTSLFD